MNKICTSIEQSQILIDLGIDIKTADMCYLDGDDKNPEVKDGTLDYEDTPAWSLSSLMELIPPGNILLRDALSRKYKCINTVDSNYYDNPVDAAFEMVCWLLENKKL